MLEITDLQMTYGQGAQAYHALKGVSLAIRPAEFFTLLGPSGCGKTTLLRSIAGFAHPTGGAIRLDGQDLLALPAHRRPVNTVFQSYALFPHMSVFDNIGFGLRMQGRPRAEIGHRVADMLARVRLEPLAHRKVAQLSGGQQQRVALARALAPRPKLLLLDEPLSALDYKLRKDMQIELKRLQEEFGITFIFVTHDQDEALTMSDRIAVMCEGGLRQIGTPRAIYDHPRDRFVAEFIGETNILTLGAPGKGGWHLANGAWLALPDLAALGRAARPGQEIALRPECARLVGAGAGVLQGRLAHSIYAGHSQEIFIAIGPDPSGGALFKLRLQIPGDAPPLPEIGAPVGIDFAPSALQPLDAEGPQT